MTFTIERLDFDAICKSLCDYDNQSIMYSLVKATEDIPEYSRYGNNVTINLDSDDFDLLIGALMHSGNNDLAYSIIKKVK